MQRFMFGVVGAELFEVLTLAPVAAARNPFRALPVVGQIDDRWKFRPRHGGVGFRCGGHGAKTPLLGRDATGGRSASLAKESIARPPRAVDAWRGNTAPNLLRLNEPNRPMPHG
jgi:hypothetical protein